MKTKKFPGVIFISIGLMINSFVLLLSHFIKMPDFLTGSLIGLGIGIMLLSLIKSKNKAAC